MSTTPPRVLSAPTPGSTPPSTEPAEDGRGVVWRFDPLHRAPAAKPFIEAEARALWQRMNMPVLSLVGERSPWIPDDLAARHDALPAARVATLLGAGHNLHHDRPQTMAAVVEWWSAGGEGALPEGLAPGLPAAS